MVISFSLPIAPQCFPLKTIRRSGGRLSCLSFYSHGMLTTRPPVFVPLPAQVRYSYSFLPKGCLYIAPTGTSCQ
jgi:hypothetical protein